MKKFVAFDFIVAKAMPSFETNFKKHRPLGIACIASQSTEEEKPRLWFSREMSGGYAPKMYSADLRRFIEYLELNDKAGMSIITWNGVSYHFDILAEESKMKSECQALAKNHIDILFQIHCELGYPLTFDAVSEGMGFWEEEGRLEAWKSPQLWIDGQHEKAFAYLKENLRILIGIGRGVEEQFKLYWTAKSGKTNYKPISKWLTVDQASQLPVPETKWVTNTIPRSSYLDFLK